MIRTYFPKNKDASIVELGCGKGDLLYYARRSGYHNISGVDYSPTQVAEAERLGIEGVRQGDMMEFLEELPDESKDAVVSIDVIEHLTKRELLVLSREVRRVLKDDGLWIIETVNAESPFGSRVLYADMTHRQAFTRHTMFQLTRFTGFRDIRCAEIAPLRIGLKGIIRWMLWRLLHTGYRLRIAIEDGGSARGAIFSQNFITIAIK